MPESFDFADLQVVWGPHLLRPEAIESAFYLSTLTHDERYLEMGRRFVWDLMRYCKVEGGYSGLRSVERRDHDDVMETFFLAETLKYLYLLFAPTDILNLNDVVFTTEAHPIFKALLVQAKTSSQEL
jgi:hypothetical protein